ncbi:hypothetical protein [Pontibaca methylaminivorans]|uniref:Uncharacterized protein n=1 Tax=Pontibaca methylaminivorans TaxID=515897 RepID=A0A1R3X704_9RHOB|nr:hypothetical protein [Pontibaca methylaminivorans]SIT86685.1 hypothetical protein SAMN05421849_2371 [Pontibaca methylaminivorans]
MNENERIPVIDPEFDRTLSELLAEAETEPVSPRLRELAKRLEDALSQAKKRRQTGN